MKTLTESKAEFEKYYFDHVAARRVVRFFEQELKHVKGEASGQPFKLEPWQYKMLRRLFGWKHRESKLRKYRTLYLEIPRKNGKSALCSGLALYCLDADKEQGAEVIAAAADSDQAAIVYQTAREMVQANPKMIQRIKTYRRSMAVWQTGSSFKVISSIANTKHGLNLSAFILDELHAQLDRELVDVLATSMAYRAQPLQVFATTAGYDKNSICWEYHDYAVKIKEGVINDPTFLAVIYAADPEDNWRDEKTWYKANPNLGKTVKLEFLREQCKKACEVIAYENTFKRLHLNLWTEQDSRWIPIESWDACKENFTIDDFKDRDCIVGIDLATTTDVTAVVAVFPFDDGTFKAFPTFYIPEDSIARRVKKDRIPYDVWVKTGKVIATPGAVCDYDFIRADLNKMREQFNIEEIVIDRWNATQLATQLQGDDFEVVFFGQGYMSMAAPTKELNSLIISHKFKHNGNEVLRWMAQNVAIEQDAAGNTKPSKRKSKEKIDGIVAILNALGRLIVKQNKTSAYLDRGIVTL